MSSWICGTCGRDLAVQGEWLRCREHFVAQIAALEEQARKDKEQVERVIAAHALQADRMTTIVETIKTTLENNRYSLRIADREKLEEIVRKYRRPG